MDITLLPGQIINTHNTDYSFNPCFNGYYTSTYDIKVRKELEAMFQSLF